MSTKPQLVRESIQEIGENSWLIGGRLLLSLQDSPSPDHTSWSDGTGSFYVLSENTESFATTQTKPLSETSSIRKIHDIGALTDRGSASAVWIVGDAVLKVHRIHQHLPNFTREHVTIEYVKERNFSFRIPEVLHHAEFDGRYYLLLEKVPGNTLGQEWVNLDHATKKVLTRRVADICKEMAKWEGKSMSGVDGNHLPEYYLAPGESHEEYNHHPEALISHARYLGLDCSTLVFYHCDLGPGNILVDPIDKSLTIIDWEIAGFVPKDWVATKFYVSGGICGQHGDPLWPRAVVSQLVRYGFRDLSDTYMAREGDSRGEDSICSLQ